AMAEELGLEHAASIVAPTMEALRDAGTPSPSGRLVIDLATLRQVQAATAEMEASRSAETAKPKKKFARVNVPMNEQQPAPKSHRGRMVAAVACMVILIAGALGIGYRWRRNSDLANAVQAPSANGSSQAPSPSPSPVASPS